MQIRRQDGRMPDYRMAAVAVDALRQPLAPAPDTRSAVCRRSIVAAVAVPRTVTAA